MGFALALALALMGRFELAQGYALVLANELLGQGANLKDDNSAKEAPQTFRLQKCKVQSLVETVQNGAILFIKEREPMLCLLENNYGTNTWAALGG